jgi:hypothetical protein
MKNLLELCIAVFAKSDNSKYMEEKNSFEEVKQLTKFFFKWNGVTSNMLWEMYNTEDEEDKKLITDIPLIKEFLKDCIDETQVESLIRSLV